MTATKTRMAALPGAATPRPTPREEALVCSLSSVPVTRAARLEAERRAWIASADVRLVSLAPVPTYTVASATTAGLRHTVRRFPAQGRWICTCPATRVCRHVEATMGRYLHDLSRHNRLQAAILREECHPSVVAPERIHANTAAQVAPIISARRQTLLAEATWGDGWASGVEDLS